MIKIGDHVSQETAVTVYVDPPVHRYGRMMMCHMAADTIDELHLMADRIGVHRRYYQGPPKTKRPHYDICKSKRKMAIECGAVEVTSKNLVIIILRMANA